MMTHQLEGKLKTLRLGGMLDTLELRLKEVQRDKLGYLEFLETLAESVILCGPVGVGKSHIAQSLGYLACRKGYKVRYVKADRLLAGLGGGHADGTWEQRLRGYLGADLLIVDDFGLRTFGPQQSEDLYELLAERYRKSSTVVVSNRPAQSWYDLFANPVLAESVLDRLVNSSHHVLMEGRSYRSVTRPGSEEPPEEGIGSGWLIHPGLAPRGTADAPPGNYMTPVLANSVTGPLGNCVTRDTGPRKLARVALGFPPVSDVRLEVRLARLAHDVLRNGSCSRRGKK